MFARVLFGMCCLAWLSVRLYSAVPDEEASRCASCAVNGSDNVSLAELRAARIEYIKTQILQKLRMAAPPRVTKPVLPDLLLNGQLLGMTGSQEDREENFSRDEFFGTAKEIIIFPDNTSIHNCYTKNETHPNSCFRFRLTHDVTMGSVASADLWVYTLGNENNSSASSNLSYTILEVMPDPTDGESYRKRFVAFEDTTTSPGWIKFQIGPAVRSWAENGHMTHALEISCAGCDTRIDTPVAIDDDRKPFIIVYTNSWSRLSRYKRKVTCTDGITSCCKEKFNVSFSEIGWNDWIVYPLEYEANFCRGLCVMDFSSYHYHHTTVMHNYVNNDVQNNMTLKLCCTPSSMKSLDICYVDEHKNVIKNTLPNMVVESCGCA